MKRLLIVDDIESYLNALALVLQDRFDVVKAASFSEAIHEVTVCRPDVALVDIRLSEEDSHNRDGLELLQWLQNNHPTVSVVLMSAYRDFDAELPASQLFLRKPIAAEDLHKVLSEAVGGL